MRITLTPEAVAHVKGLIKEHKLVGHVVRVAISPEDHSYSIDIDDEVHPRDRSFDFDGVKLVCDPRSWLFIDKTTIGYSSTQGGFTFDPPSVRP